MDRRLLRITKKGEHLLAGVRGANSQATIQTNVLTDNISQLYELVNVIRQEKFHLSFLCDFSVKNHTFREPLSHRNPHTCGYQIQH